MAGLFVRAALAVASLAVILHYAGLAPTIPGLLSFLPRLGGAPPPTINALKLLSDLNNDIMEPAGAAVGVSSSSATADDGDGHDARMARAASAALSVMYLASLPGLKEQVKETPGIVESLVRRVMSLDLAEAQRSLMQQQQPGQQRPQQGQGQGQGSSQQHVELMSSALLAVAKLAAGDPSLQAWLLGEEGSAAGGGLRSSAKRLPRGGLLARLGELLQSGVPVAWQAAASVLLHTLAGPGRDHPAVLGWAAERADALVHVGRSLVEAGAHFNSSDAVLSGAQLLEVVAAHPAARRVLLDSEAPNLLVQVVLSYAGANSSSSIVGGAVRLLHHLAAAGTAAGSAGGRQAGGGGGGGARQLVKNLTAHGLIAPLVREVRLGQPASLGPSLELLVDLIREGGSSSGVDGGSITSGGGSGDDGSGGGGSSSGDAAREAVGAGILSLCAQLLFKASQDEQAHSACCYIVWHTVARSKARSISNGGTGGGRPAADSDGRDGGRLDGLDDDGDGGGNGQVAAAEGALCGRGAEGRTALAKDLMRIMRETDFPDLHNAVLEACRDVAPARPAAAALVEAGIIPHLALLLAHNTTKSREEGAIDAATTAWVLQSQRSAAALVALLALQRELRERLVAEGALTGLATAIRLHSGRQAAHGGGGLAAQVRVTAAAALVPLLGDDGRYTRLVVAAGVLEPLVDMRLSRKEQEAQVAGRVMRALASGDEEVAAMFENLGIQL